MSAELAAIAAMAANAVLQGKEDGKPKVGYIIKMIERKEKKKWWRRKKKESEKKDGEI